MASPNYMLPFVDNINTITFSTYLCTLPLITEENNASNRIFISCKDSISIRFPLLWLSYHQIVKGVIVFQLGKHVHDVYYCAYDFCFHFNRHPDLSIHLHDQRCRSYSNNHPRALTKSLRSNSRLLLNDLYLVVEHFLRLILFTNPCLQQNLCY